MNPDLESHELSEDRARRSETELIRARLWHLSQQPNLTARERIGVCLALEVLDQRAAELQIRKARKEGLA